MHVSVQELCVHVFWSCQVHSFNSLIQQQSKHMSSFPVFTFPWWHSPSLRSYFLSRDLDEFYPCLPLWFHCLVLRHSGDALATDKLSQVRDSPAAHSQTVTSVLQPPFMSSSHITETPSVSPYLVVSIIHMMLSLFAFQCFHRWDIIL